MPVRVMGLMRSILVCGSETTMPFGEHWTRIVYSQLWYQSWYTVDIRTSEAVPPYQKRAVSWR